MAQIKELKTQSKGQSDSTRKAGPGSKVGRAKASAAAGSNGNTSPPAISALIIILPLMSMAIGVYTHYTCVHQPPDTSFSDAMNLSPPALKAQLGVSPSYLAKYDHWVPEGLYKLLLALNLGFKDILSSSLGRGVLTIIMSAATTPFAAMYLEGLRPGHPWLLNRGIISILTLLGQVLMIAAVVSAAYVPLFALSTWLQANRDPYTIRPLPSPSSSQVTFTVAVLGLSYLPFISLLFVPTAGKAFFWSSLSFQLFPFILFLTLLIRPVHQSTTPPEPRLAAARAYSLLGYATVPMYWYGLYHSIPTLLLIYRGEASWPDTFTRLICYDTAALSLAFYLLVLIQSEVDLRAVQMGGPRVHRARLFIQDALFGTAGLLIMGPGFGMGTYYARREVLAEKARFGIAPDFAMSREDLEELDDKTK